MWSVGGLCQIAETHPAAIEGTTTVRSSFQVASIRPADPSAADTSLDFVGDRLEVKNMTIFNLIKFSYDIRSNSLLRNASEWVRTQRYDIQAKEDSTSTKALEQLSIEQQRAYKRELVRGMLTERLHLQVVQEPREVSVYLLTAEKGEPKLDQGLRSPNLSASEAEPVVQGGFMVDTDGVLKANKVTMQALANTLSHLPDADERQILDRTGLTGRYSFVLHWTPESTTRANPETDLSAPSLFTSLKEQLGLRLVSSKATLPGYRIVSIERPSPN